MDLRMSPDQKWWAGGFPLNDYEIENIGPIEVPFADYMDMTPLGEWMQLPTFPSNATEEDKLGKN